MLERWSPWLLLLPAAVFLIWWVGANPLPDGYQNEYLLIGNAMDLWGALVNGDRWHLRWYAYTSYWPFGLYVVPWPFMAVLGPSRLALVLGNLVHLGLMLWAARELGRRLSAPLAGPLLLLCPGVFGSLVRYEPNLAAIAWTAAGLAFLLRSEGLRHRREVLLFGSALGLGLMMDRLTVAFFLLPPLLPVAAVALRREGPARCAKSLGLVMLAALFWSIAWYREFFLRHADEVLSQAPVGEIDAAGEITATEGPLALLYYPLALMDSQAGPLLGLCLTIATLGSAYALLRRWRLDDPRLPLLVSALGALLLFTLIAKKQVFYTLPALVPLAVLLGANRRLAWLGLVGGLWSFLAVGVGLLPGGPWLPEGWVSPRHVLARPPTHQRWPLDQALESLDGAEQLAVFSEDITLFEGFVILAAREAMPQAAVRGVVLDPVGTYENIDRIDAFLWIGAGGEWPAVAGVEAELRADHYAVDSLPPVAAALSEARGSFHEQGRWTAQTGDGPRQLVAYRRERSGAGEPSDP